MRRQPGMQEDGMGDHFEAAGGEGNGARGNGRGIFMKLKAVLREKHCCTPEPFPRQRLKYLETRLDARTMPVYVKEEGE